MKSSSSTSVNFDRSVPSYILLVAVQPTQMSAHNWQPASTPSLTEYAIVILEACINRGVKDFVFIPLFFIL
jgi:hypothetical protein